MSRGAKAPRSQRVVSKGRIRVDAAKAMAKLREHLLVDLHDYALEIVRAAVASDAPTIDVSYDADDLMVTWVGRPIAARDIVHLLDHVLTEAKGGEAQRLRLLALGVNAALGLEPAYVEIYSVTPGGRKCSRVRWKPEMLEGDGEAPRPEERSVVIPDGMGPGAVRVQLRRRVGWAVLRRAALGGAPAEVQSLFRATADLNVPVTLGGASWPRGERRPVVARVPLELSQHVQEVVRYAALEVLDPTEHPTATRPSIEMLEHGVLLARYAFEPEGFAVDPYEGVGVPVRVVVDATALPTNASRSQVRDDSALFTEVVAAADAAFAALLDLLLDAFRERETLPDTVWFADDPGAYERVMAAFTCVVVGARRANVPVGKVGRRFAYLPQFFDACGQARSFHGLQPSAGKSLIVYEGKEPLDRELSRWLSNVMWKRGHLVERVMRSVVTVPADDLVRDAREKHGQWLAFLDRDVTDVAVPPSEHHLVRESFEVTEGYFAGLVGQVAVKATKRRSDGGTLRVFALRRELAIRSLSRKDCPLPLDIAVQWSKLAVKDTYLGVEDTKWLREAIWYAIRVGVLAVCDVAPALEDPGASTQLKARVREALRCALGVATVGPEQIGGRSEDAIDLSDDSPVMTARVWRTLTPGRFVSLLDLRGEIAERGVFCGATGAMQARAIDGRIVVLLDDRDSVWLLGHFGRRAVVQYDRALVTDASAGRMLDTRWERLERALASALTAQGVLDPPRLRFERDGLLGLIAPADEARIVLAHAGHELTTAPYASAYGPVVIAVDDPQLTPNVSWNGVSSGTGTAWVSEDVERELLTISVSALGGARASRRKLHLRGSATDALEAFLLKSAKAVDAQLDMMGETPGGPDAHVEQLAALYEQLASIPLITILDEEGEPRKVSIGELDRLHPSAAPVPMLSRAPGFPTLDWHPVVARGELERAVRQFLGARAVAGDAQLEARREIAERDANRRRVLARREVDIWEVGSLGRRGAPVERYASDGITIAVSLSSKPLDRDRAIVDLLLERRLVGRGHVEALPVVARVGLMDASWFEPTLTQLRPAGRGTVLRHLNLAACKLALEMLGSKTEGDASPVMTEPGLARLCAAIVERSDLAEEVRAIKRAIRYKARWPKVQGGHTALGLCIGRTAKGEIEFGTERYAEWIDGKRKSRFDNPVVYLPDDEVGRDLRRILKSYGFELRNVTSALSKLQARRAGASATSTPKLDGEPAHPALRASVDELRIGGIEGEIELVEPTASSLDGEGRSWVMVTDLEGAAPLDVEVGCAIRAAVLVELPRSRQTSDDVQKKLARGVSLIFANVHTKLDELPPWVRDAYRAHLTSKILDKTQLYKRDERAPVFRSTEGAAFSLQELGQQKSNWFTTLSPPFPDHRYGRPVLTLTDAEVAALKRRAVALTDKTALVQRARTAEERRRAAPLRSVELPSGVRRVCLASRTIHDGDLRGEIGMLAPEARDKQGVFLHAERRPLCRLDTGGWPVVAMLDHAALEPNAYFDGLAQPKQGAAILKRVDAVVQELIEEHTRAPSDVLCEHAVEGSESVIVGGRFWFPTSFPHTPTVRVDAVGATARTQEVPLYKVPVPEGPLSPTIPIAGHVMVVATPGINVQAVLAAAAMKAAVAMLRSLADDRSELVERYRWNVALLGGSVGMRLTAPTTNGDVDQRAIRAEMSEGRTLWWTGHRGTAMGSFPGEPPPFILRDSPGSAVMFVLRSRAAAVLSELGGLEQAPGSGPVAESATPSAPTASAPVSAAERLPVEALPSRPKRADGDDRWGAPEATLGMLQAHVEDSWLGGLRRRVLSVFVDVAPPAPASIGFESAVHDALERLELPTDACQGIAFTRRGRPVRYRARDRRVVINRDHRDVLALVAADEDEPSDEAVALLVAAALSELNRAHEKVTAAEEQHALKLLARELA